MKKLCRDFGVICFMVGCIVGIVYFTLVATDSEAENYFKYKVEYR